MTEWMKEGIVIVAGVLVAIFAVLPLLNYLLTAVGLGTYVSTSVVA